MQVRENVVRVEKEMGKKFGDASNPLLFSVALWCCCVDAWHDGHGAEPWPEPRDRGGVGEALTRAVRASCTTRNARFITMYADIVMRVGREDFEHALGRMKEEKGTKFDTDLTADDLKLLVDEYLALFEKKSGKPFPAGPVVSRCSLPSRPCSAAGATRARRCTAA